MVTAGPMRDNSGVDPGDRSDGPEAAYKRRAGPAGTERMTTLALETMTIDGAVRARPAPVPVVEPGAAPAGHPRVPPDRVGVVLINLGTPDGTGYLAMRRYLGEFLSDRRVIDWPAWLWQPILQTVVLARRPFTSGAAYASIWDKARDESPLKTITRAQAEKLAERLTGDGRVVVDWAMRYGSPSIETVLGRLAAQGCRRVVLMALYPQYSATTSATAYDKAFDVLRSMRWQPAVRTMPPYHDHPAYIRLLADSVRAHLATCGFEPERLLVSYHGVPRRYLLEGDPYHCHCVKTSRLLRQELGWAEDRVQTVFQSRFGPEEWLKPYLDETLERLPREGVGKIAVISPSFVADCLETLEEIAERGRESFLHAGGTDFTYVACLNDADAHVDLIERLALRELQGWV
jgi:ferrochelatase